MQAVAGSDTVAFYHTSAHTKFSPNPAWWQNNPNCDQHVRCVLIMSKLLWPSDTPSPTSACVPHPCGAVMNPLLRPVQVAQLNVAGRAVAAANGFQVIDFELMALTLHTETYLKDRMHPKGVCLHATSAPSQRATSTILLCGCHISRKEVIVASSVQEFLMEALQMLLNHYWQEVESRDSQ